MKRKIGIIDYGINNIQSILQAIEYIGFEGKVTRSKIDIEDCHIIILPGVGAFPVGMKNLKKLNLIDSIIKNANKGKQILGICLGMQMLFNKSYENSECDGLNLIPGKVIRLKNHSSPKSYLRVPSVGWRKIVRDESSVKKSEIENILHNKYFYFLHSYKVETENHYLSRTYYNRGDEKVLSSVISENICGVQFHPEKSAKNGLDFLKLICSRE